MICAFVLQSCSYFSSNAFPLKLVFKNIDPKAGAVYTMFKVSSKVFTTNMLQRYYLIQTIRGN